MQQSIIVGQAQKELFHNEALQVLDAVVAGAVEDLPRNDPPDTPIPGTCHLVGDNPTGSWAQYPHHLAAFSAAGWRFVAPILGMTVFVKATEMVAVYGPGGWDIGTVRASKLLIDGHQLLGPQHAAIAEPTGGATVDAEARFVLEQILSALRQHSLIADQ